MNHAPLITTFAGGLVGLLILTATQLDPTHSIIPFLGFLILPFTAHVAWATLRPRDYPEIGNFLGAIPLFGLTTAAGCRLFDSSASLLDLITMILIAICLEVVISTTGPQPFPPRKGT